MSVPNSTYTEALTAAIANYSSELADNISNNNALLSFITKKGNSEPFDGGTEFFKTSYIQVQCHQAGTLVQNN